MRPELAIISPDPTRPPRATPRLAGCDSGAGVVRGIGVTMSSGVGEGVIEGVGIKLSRTLGRGRIEGLTVGEGAGSGVIVCSGGGVKRIVGVGTGVHVSMIEQGGVVGAGVGGAVVGWAPTGPPTSNRKPVQTRVARISR
ncbi:MAG TPA: hypothetical protein VNE62_06270 [Actinomycetota bacterium]|nr:hypothetical protein [Actinomycetota bacterium]